MQKSFGSSKVPEFCFKFNIIYPKIIQFDNPEPIPIIFEIEPLPEKTSVEIRDVSQRIKITSIKMSLSSWTYIHCSGNLSNASLHSDTHTSSHDLALEKALDTGIALGDNFYKNMMGFTLKILRRRGFGSEDDLDVMLRRNQLLQRKKVHSSHEAQRIQLAMLI